MIQFGLIANAGLHEDLWRMNCAKRQDHLAPRTNATDAALIGNLNARSSLVLESQPGNQCVGEHREVWPIHVRKDIRTENRLAFPIANTHVGNGCATIRLHDPAVLIFKNLNPKRAYFLKQGWSRRVRILQRLDKYRPPGSAISWIRCPLPVFDAAINIKHRFIAPPRVPCFGCKEVPVALVTASPDHCVYAGSAAQHFSHAQGNGAAIEVWVRLGLELPVSLASDIHDPLARILDSWYVIVATGLDQQNADVGIFGQTTRNYRTRRARSANDEVILSSQLGAEFLLIDANALNEFRIRRVVSETGAVLVLLLLESCLLLQIHFSLLPSFGPRPDWSPLANTAGRSSQSRRNCFRLAANARLGSLRFHGVWRMPKRLGNSLFISTL